MSKNNQHIPPAKLGWSYKRGDTKPDNRDSVDHLSRSDKQGFDTIANGETKTQSI